MSRYALDSAVILLLGSAVGISQTNAYSHFEVASIRQASPGMGFGRMAGGPAGSNDPGRVFYERVTLEYLIRTSCNLGLNQISGPSWLNTEQYAFNARFPPDTTMKQLHEMTLNLLIERFGFAFHRETKHIRGYELVIVITGAKLTSTSASPTESTVPRFPLPKPDANGFRLLAPGLTWSSQLGDDGIMRMTFRASTMGLLADRIRFVLSGSGPASGALPVPVVDRTGLSGRYDFHLAFPAPTLSASSEQSGERSIDYEISEKAISAALQKQLGLRLNPITTGLDVVVVDHINKIPTPN